MLLLMSKSALPPGPPLPAPVQTALMARYWPRFITACRHRYGDVFTVRVTTLGTMVYLADPADIKPVFAGSPADLVREHGIGDGLDAEAAELAFIRLVEPPG